VDEADEREARNVGQVESRNKSRVRPREDGDCDWHTSLDGGHSCPDANL